MTNITTRKVYGVEGLDEDFQTEAEAAAAAIVKIIGYQQYFVDTPQEVRDAVRDNAQAIMDHLRILTEPRNVKP